MSKARDTILKEIDELQDLVRKLMVKLREIIDKDKNRGG